MRAFPVLLLLLMLPACAEEAAERPGPVAPEVAPAHVTGSHPAEAGPSAGDDEARAAIARILITPDKRLDRPVETVGVLDFHSAATSEDKGFEELRARAAALGGDAVIGAEFEHGEGNEPSHLSGMVVRYR